MTLAAFDQSTPIPSNRVEVDLVRPGPASGVTSEETMVIPSEQDFSRDTDIARYSAEPFADPLVTT